MSSSTTFGLMLNKFLLGTYTLNACSMSSTQILLESSLERRKMEVGQRQVGGGDKGVEARPGQVRALWPAHPGQSLWLRLLPCRAHLAKSVVVEVVMLAFVCRGLFASDENTCGVSYIDRCYVTRYTTLLPTSLLPTTYLQRTAAITTTATTRN